MQEETKKQEVEVQPKAEGNQSPSSAQSKLASLLKKEEAEKEAEALSYQNIRGYKVIRADGTVMKEVNKVLFPVTEEEKELCIYFAKLDYLKLVK